MAEHLTHHYPEGPYTPEQKSEDLREHTHTYKAFLKLTKWTIITTAVILIGLYLFLVL